MVAAVASLERLPRPLHHKTKLALPENRRPVGMTPKVSKTYFLRAIILHLCDLEGFFV